MDNPTPQIEGQKAPEKKKRSVVPILAGSGAFLALALFGTGFYLGQSGQAKRTDDVKQQLSIARQAHQVAGTEVKQLLAVNDLLRARGLTYRASLELDRRNFGLANDYLRRAAQAADRADADAARADRAKLSEAKEKLAKTSVEPSADLETQRKAVIDIAILLDEILDER
ncbi:MAG: hypothetical protein HUU60_09335 [Armatimonadetes bacterium]|nr:hypothetical protein [Armatimonadota bacterium]